MKIRLLLFTLFVFCSAFLCADELSLIPLPQSFERGDGSFVFDKKVRVNVAEYAGDSLYAVIADFAEELRTAIGIVLKRTKSSSAVVRVLIDNSLAEEAYRLNVEKTVITINVARPAAEPFLYSIPTYPRSEQPLIIFIRIVSTLSSL
ncbi:MAG: hypothetical protein IIV19_05405 [Bacteroidaceae bacterium]|nr:hypothetical protein [Bacteroidaceae bacterium]